MSTLTSYMDGSLGGSNLQVYRDGSLGSMNMSAYQNGSLGALNMSAYRDGSLGCACAMNGADGIGAFTWPTFLDTTPKKVGAVAALGAVAYFLLKKKR